jgi:hypothetical protein
LTTPPVTSTSQNNLPSDETKPNVEEKVVVVDEPMEVDTDVVVNVEKSTDDAVMSVDENDQKSEENVEELLAAAVDEVNEKMPDLIDILTNAENGENLLDAEDDVVVDETPTKELNGNGDMVETDEAKQEIAAVAAEIKQEIEEKPANQVTPEDVESGDAAQNDILNDAETTKVLEDIKIEEDVSFDDKEIADEDKPLTSDAKRQARMAPGSKGGRRSRKPSDVNVDEESLDGRRETRSKKTSERSDELATTPAVGSGNLETASEESPLPPPSTPSGTRETRRTAAKKGTSSDGNEVFESTKDDKEDATALNVAENRRVSRLKEKEASGSTFVSFHSLLMTGYAV